MDIRKLNGLELQQALYVWSQSFERGDRAMEKWKEWEERTPTGRTTYGMLHGDALHAAFLLVDETIYLGTNGTVPMSAVCGVGVLPASRGRGYASRGMRYVFERMREAGRVISFLEPFSWEFYHRLGYAWTAPSRRYSVPSRLLPPSPETERVRAARADDYPAIAACYTRMAHRYRGMLQRRAEVWAMVFDASKTEATYTYMYEVDGVVEGYLCYHGGTRETTKLTEFVALTPRARQGLLGLLRRHEMQIDMFRWDAPANDLLWHQLMHNDVRTDLRSSTMARIIDVREALQAIRPSAEQCGSCAVSVVDAAAPWNHNVWKVENSEGAVAVEPTSGGAQVTLPVQALAQAYLGSPSLRDLRVAGEVQVHDESGYNALDTLLAGPPAWCADSF